MRAWLAEAQVLLCLLEVFERVHAPPESPGFEGRHLPLPGQPRESAVLVVAQLGQLLLNAPVEDVDAGVNPVRHCQPVRSSTSTYGIDAPRPGPCDLGPVLSSVAALR